MVINIATRCLLIVILSIFEKFLSLFSQFYLHILSNFLKLRPSETDEIMKKRYNVDYNYSDSLTDNNFSSHLSFPPFNPFHQQNIHLTLGLHCIPS